MTAKRQLPDVVRAAIGGDRGALRAIVGAGGSLNDSDADGRAALHHATINGDEQMVNDLLAAGANVDAADAMGWTALHFAASNHRVEIAKLLLRHHAQVDSVDTNGNTPLFRAVFESRGRGDMIVVLKAAGADATKRNRHGVSPADLASTISNYDIKQWL